MRKTIEFASRFANFASNSPNFCSQSQIFASSGINWGAWEWTGDEGAQELHLKHQEKTVEEKNAKFGAKIMKITSKSSNF